MTSLEPRSPYTKGELEKLYPPGLQLQLVQVVGQHQFTRKSIWTSDDIDIMLTVFNTGSYYDMVLKVKLVFHHAQ